MQLVKSHGGLGEYNVTAEELEKVSVLFEMLQERATTATTIGRMTLFRDTVHALFPDVKLLENDLCGFTAYRRGSVPYNCTGEGQQIITPVESPLSHIDSAELRLVQGDNGYFATIAFPDYRPTCVDDLADLLCKANSANDLRLCAVGEISGGKSEIGLAAIPFIDHIKECYAEARNLLDKALDAGGVDKASLEILRRAKHQQYGPDILGQLFAEQEYARQLDALVKNHR